MSLSITLVIIGITALISYQGLNNRDFFDRLKHYPVAEEQNKEYFRMLTSGFLHGSWIHLFFNMYVLLQFGEIIENLFVSIFGNFGRIIYVVFYLTAIVIADIPTFLKHKHNPGFSSIGASGAVSAVVFAFIIYNPLHGLTFIFFPFFSIPAIILGIGYLIYSSWASQKGGGNLDHMAHFAGAIYGVIFLIICHPPVIQRFIDQILAAF